MQRRSSIRHVLRQGDFAGGRRSGQPGERAPRGASHDPAQSEKYPKAAGRPAGLGGANPGQEIQAGAAEGAGGGAPTKEGATPDAPIRALKRQRGAGHAHARADPGGRRPRRGARALPAGRAGRDPPDGRGPSATQIKSAERAAPVSGDPPAKRDPKKIRKERTHPTRPVRPERPRMSPYRYGYAKGSADGVSQQADPTPSPRRGSHNRRYRRHRHRRRAAPVSGDPPARKRSSGVSGFGTPTHAGRVAGGYPPA